MGSSHWFRLYWSPVVCGHYQLLNVLHDLHLYLCTGRTEVLASSGNLPSHLLAELEKNDQPRNSGCFDGGTGVACIWSDNIGGIPIWNNSFGCPIDHQYHMRVVISNPFCVINCNINENSVVCWRCLWKSIPNLCNGCRPAFFSEWVNFWCITLHVPLPICQLVHRWYRNHSSRWSNPHYRIRISSFWLLIVCHRWYNARTRKTANMRLR